MSVLTKEAIMDALYEGRVGQGLVITPLKIEQIGASSIDVHLGNEFIIFKRASLTSFDIRSPDMISRKNVHKYQEKIRIGNNESFILHPRQMVLGATQEYISLPKNVMASICGRSTWGRTGLIIATATQIEPCYKGCITLELVNDGEIPLVLYTGIRVAQLTLYETTGACDCTPSRYHYQTGPEFPKFEKERQYLDTRSTGTSLL